LFLCLLIYFHRNQICTFEKEKESLIKKLPVASPEQVFNGRWQLDDGSWTMAVGLDKNNFERISEQSFRTDGGKQKPKQILTQGMRLP